MRLAFVVPRYGADVVGGAETLVREHAEHLARAGHEVRVLTTCARDHFSWRNELPPGRSVSNGVTVERHRITRRKDHELATALHARLDAGFPLDADAERAWVENSGHSEELLAAVDRAGGEVDALLFAPYLFSSTVFGARLHPERSLVIPCLHDEAYARFGVIQDTLRIVAGLVFNSRAEGVLAERLLGGAVRGRVVGAGFDAVVGVDPARARERHSLRGPLLAYAGRREAAKNFPLLLRWLTAHDLALAPDHRVTLAAMGSSAVEGPAEARELVADLGVVDAADKLDVIAAAVATVQPSVQESFSYLLMEGWLCGVPAIVNAGCAVTREHCEASGGGVWVEDADEFSEAVRRLLDDAPLRDRMGAAGRRYVLGEYAWPAVTARMESAIRELTA